MSDSTTNLPQMRHQDLVRFFELLGSGQSPTALHASLTGVLAAGHRMEPNDWVEWATDMMGPSEIVTADHQAVIKALYATTLNALDDANMSFRPLLPADDSPLSERLEALSDWCGSFLGAFGTVGVVAEDKALPEEIEEILEDLSAIAQVDTEQDSDAQAEEDFTAISEHVRMGVLNLYLEYNQPAADGKPAPTVH
ncbi:UPF0149 family protein [Saccharospirillum mangrovi]|uniref:UPF0149 family protein n=1 Tax=Saccharospirillum mangrovi TaxID=2161747 RepID=UPI000D378BF6|nr:UPF0149 family protein [Saccharospirillum mangrovi]